MSTSPESAVDAAATEGAAAPRRLRVLLYSDDRSTRDAVRVAVGKRPSREVEIESWFECATPVAAEEAVRSNTFDLLILDGESAPFGGLGMCRQFKHEIFECPPVVVLTGRPQDDWLAAWSYADGVVPHPLDPVQMAKVVAETSAREAVTPA
ncbi:response regulator transcription factor [Austwickia chelonae]|uniref:response regulator transcription factor n=1 Tax=Austwickia chelonae TaxID=100225 RepID=UPI000E21E555|nr:response regulator transcription factor [Austwickia chelonae]